MTKTAADWIDELQLEPHPEGGYFRETYRSPAVIPGLQRNCSTAIYFLLEGGRVSHLHRLAADEMWHFYAGHRLMVHQLTADGRHEQLRLGSGAFQGVIPAGTWFGAEVEPAGDYALVGCTVAPGFDFADFELGRRRELQQQFPQHAELIHRLTRDPT